MILPDAIAALEQRRRDDVDDWVLDILKKMGGVVEERDSATKSHKWKFLVDDLTGRKPKQPTPESKQ